MSLKKHFNDQGEGMAKWLRENNAGIHQKFENASRKQDELEMQTKEVRNALNDVLKGLAPGLPNRC